MKTRQFPSRACIERVDVPRTPAVESAVERTSSSTKSRLSVQPVLGVYRPASGEQTFGFQDAKMPIQSRVCFIACFQIIYGELRIGLMGRELDHFLASWWSIRSRP